MIPIPTNDVCNKLSTSAIDGKYSKLHLTDYEYISGKTVTKGRREFLEVKKDAAVVIIQNASRTHFLLLRQFRYPIYHATQDIEESWIYECVAGVVDAGYTPLQVAIKEAKEEAGIDLVGDDIEHLGTFWASPGISTERMHLFLATVPDSAVNDKIGKTGLDHEGELIVAKWLSWYDTTRLGVEGKIADLKTAHGLMIACVTKMSEDIGI